MPIGKLLVLLGTGLLAAALFAAPASPRSTGTATMQASGALHGKLSTSVCVVPANPLTARLHKRYVTISFPKQGATISLVLDVWKTGTVGFALTRADSVAVNATTTSGSAGSWFAGWTGTQAPSLSRNGHDRGSGTMIVSKGGHSGALNVTLVATAVSKNKRPLRLKGGWAGC